MALATVAKTPSDLELATALSAALVSLEEGPRAAQLLERRPLEVAGTSPAEVLTCAPNRGEVFHLFCKYSPRAPRSPGGTRGGVGYEAAVYRDLLAPRHAGTPRFYGAYSDPATLIDYLFLAYLDGASYVNQIPGPSIMLSAAQWLGRFHAKMAASLAAAPAYLSRFDEQAYTGWARRATRFSAPLLGESSWLGELADRFAQVVPSLLLADPTLIHGEFYPLNVLVHQDTILPVDWESAAIAAGEIDLASLTERWSDEVSTHCEEVYAAARWPGGPPQDFRQRLDAARLYLQFRWLGDRPEWTLNERLRPRFAAARLLGERLGLL